MFFWHIRIPVIRAKRLRIDSGASFFVLAAQGNQAVRSRAKTALGDTCATHPSLHTFPKIKSRIPKPRSTYSDSAEIVQPSPHLRQSVIAIQLNSGFSRRANRPIAIPLDPHHQTKIAPRVTLPIHFEYLGHFGSAATPKTIVPNSHILHASTTNTPPKTINQPHAPIHPPHASPRSKNRPRHRAAI